MDEIGKICGWRRGDVKVGDVLDVELEWTLYYRGAVQWILEAYVETRDRG
jgi:hypothetical protein